MQDKELGAEDDLDFFPTSSLALSQPELTFQPRPRELRRSGDVFIRSLAAVGRTSLTRKVHKVALRSLLVALLGRVRRC